MKKTIDNIKYRLLHDYLGELQAFVDTPTVSKILGISESHIHDIMRNRGISYVKIDGNSLISVITLIDELNWFLSEYYDKYESRPQVRI